MSDDLDDADDDLSGPDLSGEDLSGDDSSAEWNLAEDASGNELSEVNGKRIALAGRFGGMNQRQAANVLRSYGATVVDADSDSIDWVVIGAEESPIAEAELVKPETVAAAADGRLEIVHETELWQRLGLVDVEQSIRRYHTPAMLAHLLGVSVQVIRRWHRRGLIKPVHTLHKLPYFDFQEIATARRLAQWIASGASPKAIEQRLVELVEVLPNIQRPLDQLSILVEGKQVLLRHGEGLLEPGGQLRFDFDALNDGTGAEVDHESPSLSVPSVLSMQKESDPFPLRDSAEDDELLSAVYDAEDDGDLQTAINLCHALLARDGPRSDIDFQLAEMLYRAGHSMAACERYYAAIELDPEFIEARASLGIVLAELGQTDLAIAALQGALSLYEDYAEVHYNLARLLDEQDRDIEALHHWRRFLQLAPESPWAAEAAARMDDDE